jgi:hypothetical protein
LENFCFLLAVLADRRLMLPHVEEDGMRALVFTVERLTDCERALFLSFATIRELSGRIWGQKEGWRY